MPQSPFDAPDPFGSNVFKKPAVGGGRGARPVRPAEAAQPDPASAEAPAPEEEKPKEKPKAVLSNPVWSKAKARFNEAVTISVDGVLPEEIKGITKVEFQVYAVLPDGKKESVVKADGTLRAGKASKEVTLFMPQYKTPEGKLLEECKYVFTAKHRDSDEVTSPEIPVNAFASKVRFEADEGWVGVKLTISYKAVVEAREGRLPESVNVTAEFVLGTEKAASAKAYKLKPVKDADWENFSQDYTWNGFSVHAAFKQKFDGLTCTVHVKEDVVKAWGGYWIKMTRAGITGAAGGCYGGGYRWGRGHGLGMVPNR